ALPKHRATGSPARKDRLDSRHRRDGRYDRRAPRTPLRDSAQRRAVAARRNQDRGRGALAAVGHRRASLSAGVARGREERITTARPRALDVTRAAVDVTDRSVAVLGVWARRSDA